MPLKRGRVLLSSNGQCCLFKFFKLKIKRVVNFFKIEFRYFFFFLKKNDVCLRKFRVIVKKKNDNSNENYK